MSTALIFGANGQDGYYLAEASRRIGIMPVGISRSGDWIHASITDRDQVFDLFKQYSPNYAFHLAANSTAHHDAIFENHETISTGTLNILEAAKQYEPDCRIFLSGSGLQFRNVGMPIKETDPFEATSAYAVARIQTVYAARYYRSLGLKAYVGYLFHHDSPRRGPKHVSQIIAQAARRIARGSGEKLEIGDTSVRKEWAFAGDIMEGIWTLVGQDNIFEAVIGTGEAYSIEKWLEVCFGQVGLRWQEHVQKRKDFHAEYAQLVSDPACIRSLGWGARVTLNQLAKMMVGV